LGIGTLIVEGYDSGLGYIIYKGKMDWPLCLIP
jgi:hypothetical protein